MNASLLKLCNLIADVGAKSANHRKEAFLSIVENTTNRAVSEDQSETVYKVFCFLNWAYANGVWSSLSNTTLRRDLMRQSLETITLRTAHELSDDKSNEGVAAFFATGLSQEFREFAFAYNKRMKELSAEGFEPDANTARLCGLEWVQDHLGLNDDYMNIIVPQFNCYADDIAKIEELAMQVNLAANREKNGFFSRIYEIFWRT
jgi:hypothetical protein